MAYEKMLLSQWEGTCTECKQRFPVGTVIMRNFHKKTDRHKKCPVPAEPKPLS